VALMMLTLCSVVPLVGALVLIGGRRWTPATIRRIATIVSAIPVALLIVAWARFDIHSSARFQLTESASWIPSIGAGWRVGVDGIALAIALMSAVLFVAAIAFPADTRGRPSHYYAWFLFLEAVSLGLFLTTDLLVFYVFFDLGLVGMYFLIARFGHGDSRRAALTFFLYTLAGSLVMLLGIIALALSMHPLTFDMARIIESQPLAAGGAKSALVMLALVVGLAVKIPLVPVHTWLPPAHVNAPASASTILAGVMLKMGAFGMIRIPLSMMPGTFARWAPWIGIAAVVSIVYGAIVALGQTSLKARIAYTSINHMGYVMLGIAVAGVLGTANRDGRRLALPGATVEMVAHGLITGTLFLVTGSFWRRTQDYEMDDYGGLSGPAPRLAAVAVLASFASLGLPGLAGFVAEVQIFIGTFSVYPVLAAVGLIGLLITAALFLQFLQKVFFGELPDSRVGFADLDRREMVVLGSLTALIVIVGVDPRLLLDLIETTSRAVTGG
jgi:NADH-quinone oxidoreductase subunit M